MPPARSLAVLCLLLAGLSSVLSVAGCTPIGAMGTAAAATGTLAMQERGIGQAIEDNWIRAQINKAWLDADMDLLLKVGLSISEGRVMLTGVVPDQETRISAVSMAWQADGVREVINEIRIGEPLGIERSAHDIWAENELWTKLLADAEIRSINYAIDVVDGNAFVIGVARSEEELRRVFAWARNTPYIRGIVNYVRIESEDEPQA